MSRSTNTVDAAIEPKIKWMNIVQFWAVDSFLKRKDVAYVNGTIAKGYSNRMTWESGNRKSNAPIKKNIKTETSRVFRRSNVKLTHQ